MCAYWIYERKEPHVLEDFPATIEVFIGDLTRNLLVVIFTPQIFQHTTQTIKDSDFRSKKDEDIKVTHSSPSTTKERESESFDNCKKEDIGEYDIETGAGAVVHLNETTTRCLQDTDDDDEQPSNGREQQQQRQRRKLEVSDDDDGSCCSACSKHSLHSDDGIIVAQPGKELLALPIPREKSVLPSSSEEKEGREEKDGNDEDDCVLVANGCVICLEPYHSGETVVWSKNQDCIHAFHQECLIEYFQAANKDNWRLGSLFDNQSDVDNSHNDISTEFADTICPCCRQDFFLPSKKKMSSSEEESTSTQGGGTATAAPAGTMAAGITTDAPARPTTNNSSSRGRGGPNQPSAEDFVIHIP